MTNDRAIEILQNMAPSCGEKVRYPEGMNYEAIEIAIAALRATNEPLTLEQLRGTANKPYWHVGLREESAPPHWSILDPLLAYHPEDYDYGTGWLAYAYPPIDREKWTAEWEEDGECHHKPYRVRDAEKWKKYKCSKCGYKAGRRTSQKYCPSCGRAMTPEAWELLEKRLRG